MDNSCKELKQKITELESELNTTKLELSELNKQFKILSEVGTQLNTLQTSDDIYQLLIEKLRELNPEFPIILSAKFENSNLLGIRAQTGFSKKMNRIIDIIGIDPMKIGIRVEEMTEAEKKRFTAGKFLQIEAGLYELCAKKIPKPLCQAVEKLFNVGKIYSMGFSFRDTPQGGVTFLTKKGRKLRFVPLMESIIKQAAITLEQIDAKNRLKKSESRYRSISSQIPGAIFQLHFTVNKKYLVSFMSESAERLFLKPHKQLKNADLLFKSVHPEDSSQFRKTLNDSKKNVVPWTFEFRYITHTGIKWIKLKATPQKHTDESIVWNGVLLDITPKKKAEEELINSENLFRSLIESMQEGVWKIDHEGNTVYVNPAMTKMLGYSSEEMQQMHLFEFMDEQGIQKCKKLLENRKKGISEQHEFTFIKKGGVPMYSLLQTVAFVNNQGKYYGALATVMDITKRKKAEQDLQESRFMIDSILKTSAVGFSYVQNRRIKWANEAMEKLFGYTKDEYLDKSTLMLFPDEEEYNRVGKIIYSKITKGEPVEYEATYQQKNGKNFYCHVKVNLIDKNNPQKGVMACLLDISELNASKQNLKRKNAELKILNKNFKKRNYEYAALNEEYLTVIEELKESNKELVKAKKEAEKSNQLKNAFLNNISHEFRTPMNGIIGFTEFITNPGISSEKRNFYAQKINESCNRLLDIVTDTVEISQVQNKLVKANITYYNIKEDIEKLVEYIQPRAEKKQLNFSVDYQTSKSTIFIATDRHLIYRSLKHILDNALKFTNEGEINLTCIPDKKQLMIKVTDTGIGISPVMQEIIFEPFRQVEITLTRNYGGSGIGLALVKSYIKLLGGKIWLESEENMGTTVFVTLPVEKTESNSSDESNAKEAALNLENKIILVVEDEITNYLFLKEALEKTNPIIIHAKNGQEAVDFCRNKTKVDLILMDLKMPVMDGYEATKIIKEFRNEIPIIAQTAYTLQKDIEKIKLNKFDDYIAKPIRQVDLIKIIKKNIL